ncbi:pyruvate decarboxylase [Xylogone sp. PMI_703]|nr:pyruvate decarboxylase [Xylogone sp. PMI_703]
MSPMVPLVHYLFTRLRQLGIESVHGVPGDFNLIALDHLEPAGLKWIGDANELNAGYAADGYARIKGIGAIITTFGVGELSAINAIAGSYAENIPVVHIAGSPSTISQKKKLLLHHTLGDGDFSVFADIYRRVTVAQARLHDVMIATTLIDSTLRECLIKRKPVYIELPTNMVTVMVDAAPLERSIDLFLTTLDGQQQQFVVSTILERLYQAQQPVLLVDCLINRYKMESKVDELIRKSNIPTFVTPMGKSCVNESLLNYHGMYAGIASKDTIRKYVETSDLVLFLGPLKSDYNTTGYTHQLPTQNTVDIYPDSTHIGYACYNLPFSEVINGLTESLDVNKFKVVDTSILSLNIPLPLTTKPHPTGTVTHDYLWVKLAEWLKPNDILLTEMGTACLGVWDTKLPHGVTAISQTLWSSIGYTLPAAQGAALAASELKHAGRVILFEGDGSAQLTAQAIGTMLAHKLNIIIFLINNEGYTIERWVHGMDAKYNDIAQWRYTDLPRAMGGTEETVKSFNISTTAELEALWASDEFQNPIGMKFVELHMPREDAPASLKLLCGAASKRNA